jgi:preprotein translocase subunit SecG
MGIIEIFILALIILAAIILTFFVMIQDETGEGMGGIFGGTSTTPFGSRAGNVLTRITAVLAVIFFACTLGYAYLKRTPAESSNLLGKAKEQQLERAAEKPWFIKSPSESNGGASTSDQGASLLEGAAANSLGSAGGTNVKVTTSGTGTSASADTTGTTSGATDKTTGAGANQ